MRWKVFILFSVFLISFVLADIPGDCDNSMISYWKFDGDAADSFGTNHGSGGYFGLEELAVNTCSKFSGSERVLVSGVSVLGSSFTIEMIIQDLKNSANPTAVLFKEDNYIIGFDANRNINVSLGVDSFGSSFPIIKNEEYHIALVQNNTIIKLYINGEENGAGTYDGSLAGDIIIGEYFEGFIDEVAIYNSALSVETISSHYSKANAGNDYCDVSGSSADVNFTIDGCYKDGESIFVGECSSDGWGYCGDLSGVGYRLNDPTEIHKACSFGEGSAPGRGESQCCPRGYVCRDNDSGPICDARTIDCTTFTTPDDCEDERCYWLGNSTNGRCIEDPTEYSCSVYTNNNSCESDSFGLGQNGLEAKGKCGTYFKIADGSWWAYTNCSCNWDTGSNRCKLNWFVTCFLGQDCGSFNCLKDFHIGECLGGSQKVGWTVNITDRKGPFNNDTGAMTKENGDLFKEVSEVSCYDNAGIERSCGSEVVKLPGFSFFSFVMVIGESN